MKLHALCRLACLAFAVPLAAQEEDPGSSNASMDELGLEELLAVHVSSASRKEETLFQTAAAVEVLDSRAIRHTGATILPDVLRYATGVQVAQHSSRGYAISIRGFNEDVSNKLEVLMDGRSLYTPFFSGVLWDGPDYVLDDVDRIEVIRGPGSAIWGANAVNGVINIYTKGAEETQGGYLRTTIASPESAAQSARIGFQLDENLYGRVYAKYRTSDDTWFETGEKSEFDTWEMFRVGFRSDYLPQEGRRLLVEGEFFSDKLGIHHDEFPTYQGGHFLARWEHAIDTDTSYELQAYYDAYDRIYPFAFEEDRETVDFSGEFRYQGFRGHDLVGGASYRYSWDKSRQIGFPFLEPANEGFGMADFFLQDEMELSQDVGLILGATLSRNSLIDAWEFQPNARFKWAPSEQSILWAAVSRAVRTPARVDVDLRWDAPNIQFSASEDFRSEKAISYELGNRFRFGDAFSVEASLFYTEYDDLPTTEPQGGIYYLYENGMRGHTYGGELALEYRANYWSKYRLSYSHLQESFELEPESQANFPYETMSLGNDVEDMATFGALFELPAAIELSGYLRYMGALPAPVVPDYLVMDLRLAWAPRPGMEFALLGRNLLDHRHPEYRVSSPFRREISRSVQAQASFKF